MFDNFKNLAGMVGHAKQLREKLEQLQTELARKTVEADSGAGAVRVVMNGRFEVLSIKLDRPLLAVLAGAGPEADQQMIEELIAAAVNAAMARAQDLARQEMVKMTGLDLPGLGALPGA